MKSVTLAGYLPAQVANVLDVATLVGSSALQMPEL